MLPDVIASIVDFQSDVVHRLSLVSAAFRVAYKLQFFGRGPAQWNSPSFLFLENAPRPIIKQPLQIYGHESMQPITLEKRLKQGNKRHHAYMDVKNVNGIVSQMRFKLVGIDHSIPDKNKITDVDHNKYSFAIGSHEPFTFANQLISCEKFSSHYVPQMMAFVKHCHSRMIVLGDFAMHNIAVNSSGTCRYIDMSNSRLHNGGPVDFKGTLNLYHAPETHLCGKFFTSSDVYSFALWWISGMERQPVDTWGTTDPYKISSIAIEKATSSLQKEMLNIVPSLRPSMAKVVDQYAADSHGLTET